METQDARTEALIDEPALTEARKRADVVAKERNLTSDKIDYLRKRCKTDLFFLANGPLEYTKLSPRYHGTLTNWIQSNRGYQYKMILKPRGNYKSTLITIADSIQMALPNVAGVADHPYTLGPNIKLLISHEVRETAADFLYEITAAFTRKPLMLALWPECIPNKNEQRVNKWELELPRTEFHKEATFNTIGAGGAAQGGHFNWLKLDDLIGEKARDSDTVMKGTLNWFDNVNALLTDPEFDGWDLTGTRWGYSDVYSHAMKIYGIDVNGSLIKCMAQKEVDKYSGGLLKVYARGMIENGESVFPEKFPLDKLQVLRKNPLVWAAQYANNPLESGMNEFSWPLKFYNVAPNGDIIVFSGEDRTRIRVRSLDICILCDPSMGESKDADESGIIVTGTDAKFNIYILETIKQRLLPPAFIDQLYRLHFKYSPRVIAIEEVNFSAIYKYWIEDRSSHTQVYLPIRSYKPGTARSKDGRIRSLSHLFSAGQIYMHEMMNSLRDEYEQFPMGDSKHLLDALAQGPQFWTKGLDAKEIEAQEIAVNEMMDDRSALTGY